MGSHIVNGQFQSDKYPTCPPGKVPLSVKDATAQDLLWEYAQRRRLIDVEFADDLETALKAEGFIPYATPDPWLPIDTAPKSEDWTKPHKIRLWMGGLEVLGKWDDDAFANRPRPFWRADAHDVTWNRNNQPTHWQPLSPPPRSIGNAKP